VNKGLNRDWESLKERAGFALVRNVSHASGGECERELEERALVLALDRDELERALNRESGNKLVVVDRESESECGLLAIFVPYSDDRESESECGLFAIFVPYSDDRERERGDVCASELSLSLLEYALVSRSNKFKYPFDENNPPILFKGYA
jgi:hypothetical protein